MKIGFRHSFYSENHASWVCWVHDHPNLFPPSSHDHPNMIIPNIWSEPLWAVWHGILQLPFVEACGFNVSKDDKGRSQPVPRTLAHVGPNIGCAWGCNRTDTDSKMKQELNNDMSLGSALSDSLGVTSWAILVATILQLLPCRIGRHGRVVGFSRMVLKTIMYFLDPSIL